MSTNNNNNNNRPQHIHTNYSGRGYITNPTVNNNNRSCNNNNNNNNNRNNNTKYPQQQKKNNNTKHHRQQPKHQHNSKFFPLHTSCDYSFVLSRHGRSITTSNNNNHDTNATYSFHGSDEPISWDCVRIVKYLSSSSSSSSSSTLASNTTSTNDTNIIDNVICPICLDTYTCPRITKCGHTFCLSCWVQYLFTTSESSSTLSSSTSPIPSPNKSNHNNLFIAAKCPCCSQLVHFNDLKPLRIISVDGIHNNYNYTTTGTSTPNINVNNNTSTNTNNKQQNKIIKFIKLHRTKYCSTPYIPQNNFPMYYHPYSLPCENNNTNTIMSTTTTSTSTNSIIDITYKYCRYNYINCNSYIELLNYNKNEIQYQKDQQQKQFKRSNTTTTTTTSTTTTLYLDVAIDIIQREIDHYSNYEMKNEVLLQQQYDSIDSGMYFVQQQSSSNNNFYVPSTTTNNNNSSNSCSNSMNQQHNQEDCNDNSTNDNNNTAITIHNDNYDYNLQNETTTTTTTTPVASNAVDETLDIDSALNNSSNHNSDKDITRNNKYKTNKKGLSYHKKYNNNTFTNQYAGTKFIENEENEVLFYQIEDGTLCFLSPFNIKCLKEEFSITSSPSLTTASSTASSVAVTQETATATATSPTIATMSPVASVNTTERTAWDDDDDDVKQEVVEHDDYHHHQQLHHPNNYDKDDQSCYSNSINNFEQQQQQQQRGRSRTNSIISLASVSSNNSTNHHKYSTIESDNGNNNIDINNKNIRYRKNSYSSNNNDDKTSKSCRPLPDSIEGRIIEIEKKQLTPELRERYRFLSHIPYYTDIIFIEIDINYLLSPNTKNKLYNDFKKRNQYRNQKINMERQYDEKLRSKEQRIINERKAKYQSTIIDPNDEFFHPVVVQDISTNGTTFVPTGEDFGPLLIPSPTPTTTDTTRVIDDSRPTRNEVQQQQQHRQSSSSSMNITSPVLKAPSVKSFSSICKKSIVSTTLKNNNKKTTIKPLVVNDTDFPTLGAAMSTTTISSKKKW